MPNLLTAHNLPGIGDADPPEDDDPPDCGECHGDTRVECDDCDGDGCHECDQTGKVDCGHCGQTGYEPDDRDGYDDAEDCR